MNNISSRREITKIGQVRTEHRHCDPARSVYRTNSGHANSSRAQEVDDFGKENCIDQANFVGMQDLNAFRMLHVQVTTASPVGVFTGAWCCKPLLCVDRYVVGHGGVE